MRAGTRIDGHFLCIELLLDSRSNSLVELILLTIWDKISFFHIFVKWIPDDAGISQPKDAPAGSHADSQGEKRRNTDSHITLE